MMRLLKFPTLLFLLSFAFPSESFNQPSFRNRIHPPASKYNNELFHGTEVMDRNGKYSLEWQVDPIAKRITFTIIARTVGWVGLGFSINGEMKNSDLVVGGVGEYGKPYLADIYADHLRNYRVDKNQDWRLISAFETNGTTTLHISRLLDTCDPFDYPITQDLTFVLYAFGETDAVDYHFHNRGFLRLYLLDPIYHASEESRVWRISKQVTIPPQTTSYWCSIHKGPSLSRKHHMIEFHPYFENQLSVGHIHHFIIWKCFGLPGIPASDIYEPLLDYDGEECYFNADRQIPIQLCTSFVMIWGLGGQPYTLPSSTGFPIGLDEDEYYMLETHLNNPEALDSITLSSGMDIFYTSELRQNDGSILMVGYDLFGLYLVPPISTNFEVHGHCSPDCMTAMIPDEGVEVIAVGLHTHFSGRKLKLHHFSQGKELAWLQKDFNFDPTFQQVRNLAHTRKIYKGEQLTMSCELDNSWTNTTSLAGFSTRNEMCLSFMILSSNDLPYFTCVSHIPQENILSLVGVQNFTWDLTSQERVVRDPASLAGQTLQDVSDDDVEWTKRLRYEMQDVHLNTPQVGSCPIIPDLPVGRAAIDDSDIPSSAYGYGVETRMGSLPIPHHIGGPQFPCSFPGNNVQKYSNERYCQQYNIAHGY